MIPKASQRGNGADLATHLLRLDQNERISDLEIRGAIARDLHGAFEEWELQAHHLTRCENYLYSTSISPDPKQEPWSRELYAAYIDSMEEALGLEGQPRAVIFHEKKGREHAHVVWSRIKAEEGKAVHLAFDHLILMEVSREFAKEHGIELTNGYGRKDDAKQQTFFERAQADETGLTLQDHRASVTRAWQISDSPRAFVKALEERGYVLATGKRPYVVVDIYGHPHALQRMIDEPGIRTKDIEKRLGATLPPELLPTVEEARSVVARFSNAMEDARRNEQRDEEIAQLALTQEQRRRSLTKKQFLQKARHAAQQKLLQQKQTVERHAAKQAYLDRVKKRRMERASKEPKGLAGFLGKVSGINALRRRVHRYQDKKVLREFREGWQKLKEKQEQERQLLKQEQILQKRVLEKKDRKFKKVENREKREMEKKLAAQYRTEIRRGTKEMPAIPHGWSKEQFERGTLGLEMNIASGRRSKIRDKNQLTAEFKKATAKEGDEKGSGERVLRPTKRRRPRRRKTRDPGRER